MQTENSQNKFEGFVLAGGKSSRMGTNKAFLKFGNETFLEHAINILKPVCDGHVKIILNQNQSLTNFSSFEHVRDIFAERGALGGIHAALINSKNEWTIILACDLPLVTSETILELSQIALDSSNNTAAIVPKQVDGRLQPLCAVYRKSECLPKLEELLQTQDSVSVQDFLKQVPTIYVEADQTLTNKESIFFNVNAPADYEMLLELNTNILKVQP